MSSQPISSAALAACDCRQVKRIPPAPQRTTVISAAISGGISILNAADRIHTMMAVMAPAAPPAATFLTGNADGERASVVVLIDDLLLLDGDGRGRHLFRYGDRRHLHPG